MIPPFWILLAVIVKLSVRYAECALLLRHLRLRYLLGFTWVANMRLQPPIQHLLLSHLRLRRLLLFPRPANVRLQNDAQVLISALAEIKSAVSVLAVRWRLLELLLAQFIKSADKRFASSLSSRWFSSVVVVVVAVAFVVVAVRVVVVIVFVVFVANGNYEKGYNTSQCYILERRRLRPRRRSPRLRRPRPPLSASPPSSTSSFSSSSSPSYPVSSVSSCSVPSLSQTISQFRRRLSTFFHNFWKKNASKKRVNRFVDAFFGSKGLEQARLHFR